MLVLHRRFSVVVKDLAVGAEGLEFNFQAGQNGRSRKQRAIAVTFLRSCVVQPLSGENCPRHSLLAFRNTANIMKI